MTIEIKKMRKKIAKRIFLFGLMAIAFVACKKETLQVPPTQPNEQPPPKTNAEIFTVKLQAVVTIGGITYDSIPAQFRITFWDSNNVAHQKDTLLAPGVNIVRMPKAYNHFQFSMNKWGISDSIMLQKDQVQQDVVYILGGSKAARKMLREESFLFVMGAYQPSSKIYYDYDTKGLSAVEFYRKKPQSSELQFTHKHLYKYSGSNVSRIDVFDENNSPTGFTDFIYNEQGTQIANMHQKAYDVETFAAVEHGSQTGVADITIDYLFNNGHSMEYKMKIRSGNKTEDHAVSSTGGGEGGTYKYDFNINPFAHMNMPNIFLPIPSKNNLMEQQKNFSGSVPSAVVYKHEYAYDNEGYPIEVVKHYKGYLTGEHLYKIKTVYTYL